MALYSAFIGSFGKRCQFYAFVVLPLLCCQDNIFTNFIDGDNLILNRLQTIIIVLLKFVD